MGIFYRFWEFQLHSCDKIPKFMGENGDELTFRTDLLDYSLKKNDLELAKIISLQPIKSTGDLPPFLLLAEPTAPSYR